MGAPRACAQPGRRGDAKVVTSAVTHPMPGANLGAIRRTSPQTVMDEPGHVNGEDRARHAEQAHLIRKKSRSRTTVSNRESHHRPRRPSAPDVPPLDQRQPSPATGSRAEAQPQTTPAIDHRQTPDYLVMRRSHPGPKHAPPEGCQRSRADTSSAADEYEDRRRKQCSSPTAKPTMPVSHDARGDRPKGRPRAAPGALCPHK